MRTLNKNERMLAFALGGVVFLIFNLVAFRWVTTQLREERAELAQARTQIEVAEALLAERPHWEALGRWMEQNPIETYAGQESDSAFAEAIQRGVEAGGLSVQSQSLREAEIDGDLVVVGLDLDVRGRLEPMIRWLNELQQPGAYVTIESFTLKRADADSTMRLQLRVRKIFRTAQLAQSP